MSAVNIQPIENLRAKQGKDRLEYFYLPGARVIGKSMRCPLDPGAPNPIPAFWGKCDGEGLFETVKTPSRILPAMLGFTDDFDAKTNSFRYIVGALFAENSPVPEGYVFRDIPATVVSKSRYGEWLNACKPEWAADGFEWNGDKGQGWNAELYLDGEDNDGFRLMCAVKAK